jgi:dihydropyrimidinase
MSDFDTVVRAGRVVTTSTTATADIGVGGGRILALAAPGTLTGRRTIDAEGLYVLPGIIDVHVHTSTHSHHVDPLGKVTQVAAAGGVTSVLVFLIPRAGYPGSPIDMVQEFRQIGEADAVIDFGFHIFLPERAESLEQIPQLIALGVPSFKLFLAYKSMGRMCSDAFLYDVMKRVGDAGGLLLLHAEDGELIDLRTAEQVRRGRTKPEDFLYTHPPEAEYIAIQKALHLGRLTGCPLYILHVSTALGAAMVSDARRAGQVVWGETCPQYVTLTNDALTRFGPLAKVGPPLRDGVANEGLGRALRDGHLQVVGSDHSAQSSENKERGYDNIFECSYGAPGVETLLPVFHDYWVNRRGGTIHQLVAFLSEQPAKIFGLYPRKGSIQVGADADLVLFDPEARWVVTASGLHSQAGYTLHEGLEVRGRAIHTLVRGQTVLEEGQVKSPPGYGRFLARGRQVPDT